MRICILGAGAIGGYFGARLLQAKRDVTFLVRPARAARLAKTGLVMRSPKGDATIAHPPTVLADAIEAPFDLVILSCKAYDLDDAMNSLAPAVGDATAILPLLNGMAHLDRLDARFGPDKVLGGQCVIGSTLEPDGTVKHLNEAHAVTFGERAGGKSDRISAIESELSGAGFDARSSDAIVLEMWEKWMFLSSLAAGTSLMRAPIGDVVAAPGGRDFMLGLLEEVRAIAEASGFKPRDTPVERTRAGLTAAGSPMTASMARDLANGYRVEADHVIGDLIRRGENLGIPTPRFETAYIHLKAYEAKRARG